MGLYKKRPSEPKRIIFQAQIKSETREKAPRVRLKLQIFIFSLSFRRGYASERRSLLQDDVRTRDFRIFLLDSHSHHMKHYDRNNGLLFFLFF